MANLPRYVREMRGCVTRVAAVAQPVAGHAERLEILLRLTDLVSRRPEFADFNPPIGTPIAIQRGNWRTALPAAKPKGHSSETNRERAQRGNAYDVGHKYDMIFGLGGHLEDNTACRGFG